MRRVVRTVEQAWLILMNEGMIWCEGGRICTIASLTFYSLITQGGRKGEVVGRCPVHPFALLLIAGSNSICIDCPSFPTSVTHPSTWRSVAGVAFYAFPGKVITDKSRNAPMWDASERWSAIFDVGSSPPLTSHKQCRALTVRRRCSTRFLVITSCASVGGIKCLCLSDGSCVIVQSGSACPAFYRGNGRRWTWFGDFLRPLCEPSWKYVQGLKRSNKVNATYIS